MAEKPKCEWKCRKVAAPTSWPTALSAAQLPLMWSGAVGWWEGKEGKYVPCLGVNHGHGRAGAADGGSVTHDYRLQQRPTLQVPPIPEHMDSSEPQRFGSEVHDRTHTMRTSSICHGTRTLCGVYQCLVTQFLEKIKNPFIATR